jgi:Protein of unknown function DUF2625
MKRILLTIAFYALILAACFSQVPHKKTIKELVSSNDTSWNKILELKASARNIVEILPKDHGKAEAALIEAQLPANTFLGSIIYESGGILVDKGWIRILGSGCTRLNRSVPSWNKGKTTASTKIPYTFMLVADDVLGGMFALKSDGKQSPDSCIVYYYGPNSLKWKATGFNYRTFISYCFSGSIKRFYDDFRWAGWEQEVSQMDGNQVISCFPLLWTRNALEQKSNRKIVTVQKQWEIYPKQTKFTSDQNLMVNN